MKSSALKATVVLVLAMLAAGCSDDDDETTNSVSFLGDTVTVANTFQDGTLTGGNEVIYGLSDPAAVSDPEVELPNFINFYDMDFTSNSLIMTLVNNSDAADLVLPAERFDRYYVGFASNTVASASLDGAEELNEFATVTILPAGFVLNVADTFGTGISLPIDFAQGGLRIELAEGTDLSNTGVTVRVNFE